MRKASESRLSELHSAVAETLMAQVTHKEQEMTFDAHGEQVETGDEIFSATPATIATAVKFLKDNSITCDIEQDENMSGLRNALKNKQKRSRMGNPQEAAQSLAAPHQ